MGDSRLRVPYCPLCNQYGHHSSATCLMARRSWDEFMLYQEMQMWEQASDETFINFEESLEEETVESNNPSTNL